MKKEQFMDNHKLGLFIENKYNKRDVIVDEWYLIKDGWEIQIIWRTPDIPLLGSGTTMTRVNLREYTDWLTIYLRTQKIKKIFDL